MEMSTKLLDLGRALAETAVKGNSVIGAGNELYSWLVRERIDETEWTYCAKLTSGVAYPNEYGCLLREGLAKSNFETKSLGGLKLNGLKLAGSVGRLIAFDTKSCYMVTTVAVLMAFHDMKFAINVLCNMALDTGGHEGGVDYPYDIRRTRIKPVISKIVESIALNVVNSGHTIGPLPDELGGFCVHVMDPNTFAAVATTVFRATEDIVLLCDVLYGDLVAWILAHFMGTFEISIAGRRAFEKLCGKERPRASVVVMNNCTSMAENHPNVGDDPSIYVSVNTSGVSKRILHAVPNHLKGATPSIRSSLYNISNAGKKWVDYGLRLETAQSTLTPSDMRDILVTAQSVLGWLLKVPVRPGDSFVLGVGFSVDLDSYTSKLPNIGSLLRNWPGLLQQNLGHSSSSIVIFFPPSETSKEKHATRTKDGGLETWSKILECFPTVQTLLENVRGRCRCNSCLNEGSVDYCRPGCLRTTALTMFLRLISHGIAEGFGAPDVSGICNSYPEAAERAIRKLIAELIYEEIVLWNTWFSVAAFNFLGCSVEDSLLDGPGVSVEEGASEIVAAQYGSLVVVANWADLTVEQRLAGSFGFYCTEGVLAGVNEEYAIINSEKTMQAPEGSGNDVWTFSPFDDAAGQLKDSSFDISAAWQKKEDEDDEPVNTTRVQTAIIGAGSPYRLLTMIKSSQYLRIVDPSMNVLAISRSESLNCEHNGPHTEPLCINPKTVSFWTFDDLLGGWDTSNRTFDIDAESVVTQMSHTMNNVPMFYVTTCQKTHLGLNVAMSLSPFSGCLLKRADQCLSCAIKRVTEREGRNFGDNGPRIVVSDFQNSNLLE